eukprot:6189476-Pleurochrysis_carterae.AAC.1
MVPSPTAPATSGSCLGFACALGARTLQRRPLRRQTWRPRVIIYRIGIADTLIFDAACNTAVRSVVRRRRPVMLMRRICAFQLRSSLQIRIQWTEIAVI